MDCLRRTSSRAVKAARGFMLLAALLCLSAAAAVSTNSTPIVKSRLLSSSFQYGTTYWSLMRQYETAVDTNQLNAAAARINRAAEHDLKRTQRSAAAVPAKASFKTKKPAR